MQVQQPESQARTAIKTVGAGLLAKAEGQSLQEVTDLAPSRASPLPHLGSISRLELGCAACSNAAAPRIPSPNSDQNCGSGLARESGGSVAAGGGWSNAFASKPAPTFGVYFKVGTVCVPPAQMPVQHPESQARTAIKTVGAGLPAMAVRRVDSYRLANRYPRQAGSYSWSCFDSQLFMR